MTLAPAIWAGRRPRPAHAAGSGPAAPVYWPLFVFAFVLALGNAAFLAGMLRSPWLSMPAVAVIALTGWALFARRPATPPANSAALWGLALLAAAAVCVLGGQGRLLYANADWQIRDAVLFDMTSKPWPVTYESRGQGELVLRAPLGMFVLPSLFGRLLGWGAANVALLAQNALLLGAVFAVFLSRFERWAGRLTFMLVFLAFSGLDLFGALLADRFTPTPHPWSVPHLERWAGGLQYSSLLTDLFWAPNHALPALILTAAYVAWRKGEASLSALAALAGLSLLWSPLAVIGATPFLVVAFLTDARRGRVGFLAPAALVPLAVVLLPVAAYLTAGSVDVVQGLNIQRPAFAAYLPFMALEILPLLWLGRPNAALGRGALVDYAVCAAVLVFFPMYIIGAANDFMMRSSIPAIALLAMRTAENISDSLRGQARWKVIPPIALLSVGAATPACEIGRALTEPVNPPQRADLLTARQAPEHGGFPITTYAVPREIYDSRNPALRRAAQGPGLELTASRP